MIWTPFQGLHHDLGSHGGSDQHPVFGAWFWGKGGTPKLPRGSWEEAKTKRIVDFFLTHRPVRSPWRIYVWTNSGKFRKWNLKAGDICLHSIRHPLLKLSSLLAKLCIFVPWGMDLMSSDNTATWIQGLIQTQWASWVYGYLRIDLQGLISPGWSHQVGRR